jgi:hypothetical protein
VTSASHRYQLYGMMVDADRPLPGLPPISEAGDPALYLRVGSHDAAAAAANLPVARGGNGEAEEDEGALELLRSADGAWYRLRYRDGTEFSVSADSRRIGCSWRPPFTVEDAATYLYGPVLGFVLRRSGASCLHASAVEIGDGAALLCGPALAGKSTTAAALAARGHRVLADDVSALDDGPSGVTVRAAYPQLRLWPRSAGMLYGEGAELPPLTPNWDKRYLDLDGHDGGRFRSTPLPVHALYLLAAREETRAPRLEPLTAIDAVAALVGNSYLGWLPDLAAQGRDLLRYAALARQVPVWRLVPHTDPARLGELCALVERGEPAA